MTREMKKLVLVTLVGVTITVILEKCGFYDKILDAL